MALESQNKAIEEITYNFSYYYNFIYCVEGKIFCQINVKPLDVSDSTKNDGAFILMNMSPR